jgi:uncharacterized protein (DUF2062 family)
LARHHEPHRTRFIGDNLRYLDNLARRFRQPKIFWGFRRLMYRRYIRPRLRRLLRQARRFIYHTVLHADDPPDRLALGAAIGIFVTLTPTVGFQMMISVFLAWLLRANKAIGIPIVWISNPATIVPMYYSCYVLGRFMLGWPAVSDSWWSELSRPPEGWWTAITFYWSRFVEIAAPLWLGSIVIGMLLAYPTYYALYWMICSYRMRRWGRLMPPPP